ncbi:11386_t:CDS:2, partial [Gigaspora margarita]
AFRKSFYNRRGSTSTNGEIEAAQEPIWDSNHEHENMQAEVTQQGATAELAKVAINVKSTHDIKGRTSFVLDDRSDKEIVVELSDTAKVAKEEDTHEEAEMVAEPSDPLRDELSNLYGTTENKENLLLVAVTKDINVEDVQASICSQ